MITKMGYENQNNTELNNWLKVPNAAHIALKKVHDTNNVKFKCPLCECDAEIIQKDIPQYKISCSRCDYNYTMMWFGN